LKPVLRPLADQVILVTGASSGIGLVTARLAAKRGAKLMLVARNGAALRDIVDGIGADGGQAHFAVADVGDPAALGAAADAAIARFGRIDTWVNNAGVAIYAPLMDTPDDEHERLFRTNYFGVVNGSRLAVRHLRRNGGALITVASIAADMPSPIMGAYAASKHASRAFTESLRIELAAAGLPISVSLVKPSGIATPIAVNAANHLEGEAKIPPPVYDPALVAEAILHCAAHRRRDITVGGLGRLEVLFAKHAPALFERLAPGIVPLLSDPAMARTTADALDRPVSDGAERAPHEHGIRHSPYGLVQRHRAVATLAVGAGLLAILAAGPLRRRLSRA
jgi:NAD(P)-dependent dehydrogenase (short-subunit alcohol dehydrogenase family)